MHEFDSCPWVRFMHEFDSHSSEYSSVCLSVCICITYAYLVGCIAIELAQVVSPFRGLGLFPMPNIHTDSLDLLRNPPLVHVDLVVYVSSM